MIFICPLIAVEAFLVAILAAEMEYGPNVVLSTYPIAGGQIEEATAASGTVTGEDRAGRGGVVAERGEVRAVKGVVTAERGGVVARRGVVIVRRGGATAERGGVAAEGDTVEMGKSIVVAEAERKGSQSNQ